MGVIAVGIYLVATELDNSDEKYDYVPAQYTAPTGACSNNVLHGAIEPCSTDQARRVLYGKCADDYPEFNAIVYIGAKNTVTGETFTCTGTIIDRKYVLSAEHCVEDGETVADYTYYIFYDCNDVDSPNCKKRGVKRFHYSGCFIRWSNTLPSHDIVLMELESEVEDTITIPYIHGVSTDVHTPKSPPRHTELIGAGFGISDNYKCTQFKFAADLTVPEWTSACYSMYPTICANFERKEDGAPCKGDSGSPLFRKSDMVLYGVLSGRQYSTRLGEISSVDACLIQDARTIYTPVVSYANWILDVIQNGDQACPACNDGNNPNCD